MLSTSEFQFLVIFGCLCGMIVCPPVTEKPEEEPDTRADDEVTLGVEYERYLKEVVSILESDPGFKKKLEESNVSEIKSGEIAKHLDFVNHGIRSKLDEVKRKELDRLRQMMRLRMQVQNGMKQIHPDIAIPGLDRDKMLAHLDHSNPNSFEVSDLAKLIQQTTKDLEMIDQKRREDFKNYEMEKEVVRRDELEKLDAEHRAEEEKKFEEMQKKHQDHPKLHHPGNEEQLKEVWEESDGLNKEDFDPKTFFYLHDTNGDGVLDQTEIEALFQKELDKAYDPTAPEDDMMERYEEMNRMREHVMNEVDKNKDKMISLDEFLDTAKNEEFKKDDSWETLDNQQIYSEQELVDFEKQYDAQKLQRNGEQHGREEKGGQAAHDAKLAGLDHQQLQQPLQQQFQQKTDGEHADSKHAEDSDQLKTQPATRQENVQNLPRHPRAPPP